jgi:hypothetical protein
MERKFKAAEKVLVFDTHEEARTGKHVDSFRCVPRSRGGYDSYSYKGEVYPGYVNTVQVDGAGKKIPFIILNPAG